MLSIIELPLHTSCGRSELCQFKYMHMGCRGGMTEHHFSEEVLNTFSGALVFHREPAMKAFKLYNVLEVVFFPLRPQIGAQPQKALAAGSAACRICSQHLTCQAFLPWRPCQAPSQYGFVHGSAESVLQTWHTNWTAREVIMEDRKENSWAASEDFTLKLS